MKLFLSSLLYFLVSSAALQAANLEFKNLNEFKRFHTSIIDIMIKQESADLFPLKLIKEGSEYDRVSYFLDYFINRAYAHHERGARCVFGGWPSFRSKSHTSGKMICRVPWRYQNTKELEAFGPRYDKHHYCGAKTLFRCNPLIFGPGPGGKGHCIKISNYSSVTKTCSKKMEEKENVEQLFKKFEEDSEFKTKYQAMSSEVIRFCDANPKYDACEYLKKSVNEFYKIACNVRSPDISAGAIDKAQNDINKVFSHLGQEDGGQTIALIGATTQEEKAPTAQEQETRTPDEAAVGETAEAPAQATPPTRVITLNGQLDEKQQTQQEEKEQPGNNEETPNVTITEESTTTSRPQVTRSVEPATTTTISPAGIITRTTTMTTTTTTTTNRRLSPTQENTPTQEPPPTKTIPASTQTPIATTSSQDSGLVLSYAPTRTQQEDPFAAVIREPSNVPANIPVPQPRPADLPVQRGFQKRPAPGNSQAVNVKLPRHRGDNIRRYGFYLYGPYRKKWATERTAWQIQEAGRKLSQTGTGIVMGVGNISKQGGGYLPPHQTHRHGKDVDLRLIDKNGNAFRGTYSSSRYSRDKTFKMLNAFISIDKNNVRSVIINDSRLRGMLQRQWRGIRFYRYKGHHDHIHVSLKR